ncbi:hypothetical protein VQ056_33395, partial [Paenibacillus sp. JTLBN-2024]
IDWIVTATGLLGNRRESRRHLVIPATLKAASIGLAVLFMAMFPPNGKKWAKKLTIGGRPAPKLLLRTALQLVFIVAVLRPDKSPAFDRMALF